MTRLTYLLAFVLCLTLVSNSASEVQAKIDATKITATKIWDKAPYNAFTDIIHFNGQFYCTFREGTGHIPGRKTGEGDGTIRVLSSQDGKSWTSVAHLKKDTYDLRDAKISITPDNRLMILMGGSIYVDQCLKGRISQVSFSDKNGVNFSDPQPIQIDPTIRTDFDWLWRVTWYQGTGYGVVYQIDKGQGAALSGGGKLDPAHQKKKSQDWSIYLVKTTNGIDYTKVAKLNVAGKPNESTVRFNSQGEMSILVRREASSRTAFWGTSSAPYTEWTWTDLGESIGGPNHIWLPDGHYVLGGRVKNRTGIGTIDENGKFQLLFNLPSSLNGDNSYPGFVIVGDQLWISWYSHHESKASIYLTHFAWKDLFTK